MYCRHGSDYLQCSLEINGSTTAETCNFHFQLPAGYSYLSFSELEDKKWPTEGDDRFISIRLLCFFPIMWLCKAASPMLEMSIVLLQRTHIALVFDEGSAAIQALNFSSVVHLTLKTHFPIVATQKKSIQKLIRRHCNMLRVARQNAGTK